MGVGRVEFWTKAFVRLLHFSVWVFGVWVWPDSCYDFRFQLHQSTSRVNAPSKNTIPSISTVQRKHIDFKKLTKKRMQVVFRKLGEISSCFLYIFISTQPYLSVLRCIHTCTRMNHAKIKDASIMEDMLKTTRVPSTASLQHVFLKQNFKKKSYLASEYFQLRVNDHEIKRGFVKVTFN